MDPGTDGRAPRATSLWRSFGHAWDGLAAAAATQRNMRIHLVAGILAGAFAGLAPLGGAERALLVLCIALVISAEAANTALEALVDLHGPAPSAAARLAKDAAAGAVLVLAVASVAVFAVVTIGCWREMIQSWRTLVAPAAAGVGLAAVATILLARPAPVGRARALGALAGVILVTALGASSACAACALVPAGLFAVAVAATAR